MAQETFYLPKESVTLVNYPVLREQRDNIERILVYALRVETALVDFNEARYDKIDINMDEVNQYVTLCRQTSEAIGTADSIPFDILIELRTIQAQLHQLVYLYQTQSELVGTPTTTVAEEEGGI